MGLTDGAIAMRSLHNVPESNTIASVTASHDLLAHEEYDPNLPIGGSCTSSVVNKSRIHLAPVSVSKLLPPKAMALAEPPEHNTVPIADEAYCNLPFNWQCRSHAGYDASPISARIHAQPCGVVARSYSLSLGT
jgi:hypothetical protein